MPLGYLIGWLLLMAATRGGWAAALILPAYFLADSGVTLFRRTRRGASILEAHSEHFYQRAIRAGRSHGRVAVAGAARQRRAPAAGGRRRARRAAGRALRRGLAVWLLLRVLARQPAAGRGPDA